MTFISAGVGGGGAMGKGEKEEFTFMLFPSVKKR